MRPVFGRLLCQTVVLTLALGFVACTDTDTPLNPSVRALYTTPTGLLTANPPQIFVGAGDISSCSNTGDEATAKLLDAIPDPATVYNIGDDAYDNGTTAEFACYNSTWGRHKYRTKPTPGNHEYNTSGATPYYAYFGAAAGPSGLGYYSFNLGAWHIISLNSNVSRSVGSAQDTWLANDLAAHPNQCTLAYWHHPLYSSTGGSGSGGVSIASMQPFWNRLYAAHADLVLNGHRHFYERMKPMKPDGSLDLANGITQIIAGSGGIGGGSETNLFPLHVTGDGATFGVLKLYLYDDSFAWKFIPVAGKTYTDSGSTACHSSGGGGGGPGPVSATNSSVSASPTSFTVGSGSSTITVTARDGSNNLLSGSSVSLTSTGSGNTFTPSSGTTNGSGVFTSTFTSSVAEGKTISANIDGTAITQTASVTVNSSGGGGGGTITQTLLTSGGNAANQSVYTTASIAPAANALVTVAVLGRRSSGALTPTVSGGGISTWTQVANVDYDPIGTPASRLVVFRGMSGAPGSGPITITFTSSMSNATWMVSQWTGVDQTGTNGSGAIGQTGSIPGDGVTSLSKALAAFGNANNVGFGVVGVSANPPFVTPGAGSSEIGEVGSTESTDLETQSGVNDNTIAATLNSTDNAGLLAIEIRAGGGGAPTVSATNSTVAATSPITAGGAASTITITAKDGSGNPISGATVVLAATGTGNTLTQPSGTTASDGTITGALGSTKAENKVVSATINGVAITQQATVTVAPAPEAVLAFTGQPSNAQANAPIAPAVTVEVRDAFGNHVNSSASVVMAIGTNPGSGTLAGTTTQTAASGVATFADLAINNTGTGYTLAASAASLTGATSSAFNITPPVPSATNSTVSAATPSFTAGGSSAINILVKDGLGNVMPGVTVTLSSSVGGDVVTQPAAATDVNGVTSGSVAATSAGARTITVVAGGITLNQKPSLTVSAATADAGTSTVSASPTSITAGSGSSTITVTVRDQYGNLVSGSTVLLATSGTNFTLTQPSSATGSNGVATGSLSSTDPQSFTVSATAGGTAITQTAAVTVTPPNSAATITHTLLTSGANAVNLNSYATAAIAPGANKLITVAVLNHRTPAAISPTLSGGGMTTWTLVASVDFDTIGGSLRRLSIFRAMSASPGSGPITITFSNSVSNVEWIVSQWDGVDISGVNGSGAIVQSGTTATNGSNGLSVALAPFANANNVAYGAFGANKNVVAITPGAGYTKIDEQPSGENTPGDLLTEWAVNLNPVNATWTSLRGGAIGIEIKAATGP